ncbi:hypothetical protein [Cardinium endosymbiont of Oedothorax gibbosus]|nr:hypothetical protein [Cardinium endosymbiont of Oedothorax gibbosus]
MLKLIKQTLTTSIVKQGKITCKKVGVPQGSPISPLYSNLPKCYRPSVALKGVSRKAKRNLA